MNKKLIAFLPLFLLTSCGSNSQVILSDFYYHESSERDDVFSHEITSYSSFENMNKNKKSYIMYIYNDKYCMCYLELKRISAPLAVEYNLLIYTMDVEIIENKNTYGYSAKGHDFPSICIFDQGKLHSSIHYDNYEYFESESKFSDWIFERIKIEE